MPVPQGGLKISSNSDRAFPNPDVEPITDIPRLNDIDRPSTSVEGNNRHTKTQRHRSP
jgi:hypothetical protein